MQSSQRRFACEIDLDRDPRHLVPIKSDRQYHSAGYRAYYAKSWSSLAREQGRGRHHPSIKQEVLSTTVTLFLGACQLKHVVNFDAWVMLYHTGGIGFVRYERWTGLYINQRPKECYSRSGADYVVG